MEYLVQEYNAGNPLYHSNDFILVKNKVSDATAKTIVTELAESKGISVQQDIVVIINTRNAVLDMIISTYQECATTGGLTTRWNSATAMHIMLTPGSVYNNHSGRYKMITRLCPLFDKKLKDYPKLN